MITLDLPHSMDSSLLSNIQKLFYERIEVFSKVEFSKLSIVTGIVKIFLKVSLSVHDITLKPRDIPPSPAVQS